MQFRLLIVSRKHRPDSGWILYLALSLSIAAFATGVWGMLTVGPWHIRQFGTSAFKDVTGGLQSLVTAAGVLVGGSWAYFKFVRGRTHQPRLSVELAGQWRTVDQTNLLHVRVRVTNLSATLIRLNQYGCGLHVAFPSNSVHNEVIWKYVQLLQSGEPPVDRSFEVLREHAWIEPQETGLLHDQVTVSVTRPDWPVWS